VVQKKRRRQKGHFVVIKLLTINSKTARDDEGSTFRISVGLVGSTADRPCRSISQVRSTAHSLSRLGGEVARLHGPFVLAMVREAVRPG
jgi:hypothetical protein